MVQTQSFSQRFLKKYYIINTILLTIYPITKLIYPELYHRGINDNREYTIFFMFLVLFANKFVKAHTLEQCLVEFFFYAKIALISVYYFNSTSMAIWYVIICVGMWVLFKIPKYDGPNKQIKLNNFKKLADYLDLELKAKKNSDIQQRNINPSSSYLFVEFYEDFVGECITTKEIWASISNIFTTKNLKFAEVDLARMPSQIAQKFNINTSGLTKNLPTLILFKDKQEVLRYPPLDDKTKKVNRYHEYNKEKIVKYFDLESIYLETRDN